MQLLNDILPSWRDTPTKQAILNFVTAVTDESGPSYVPPAERIAYQSNQEVHLCFEEKDPNNTVRNSRFLAVVTQPPTIRCARS